MAIRTFNSVGGFSVGEIPDTIIFANGNISTELGVFNVDLEAGNVKSDHLLYANGQPWHFTTPGGSNTFIQFNDGGADLGGTAAFSFDKYSNLLSLTGNANIGNVNTTGQINSDGNVTAPWFIGNIVGNISGNIIIPGYSTGVVINDGGNANAFAGFTFDKANNAVSITGNLTAGNVSATNLAGTLTTAAQTNITSVGTLTSLSVTNTITGGNLSTGGNLTVSGQVISDLIPANDNTYTLGNTSYQWKNVYVSGNVFFSGGSGQLYSVGSVLYTDALRTVNEMSAGTLTARGDSALQGNVVIGGNLTVGGSTTYINVETISVKDPIISLGGGANNANAASYDLKDRGVFLRNYKSDETGPINMYMGWDTSSSEFAFGSNVYETGDVITFNQYGNVRANVILGNVSGQLLTAEQTNITSVGTLTNLTVSGIANIQTLANVANLYAGGLYYPTSDGSTGQFLRTDGSGHLSWQTVSTSSIANGTSNVNVQENSNVQIVVNNTSVANITPTGANVTGTLNVSGNATVGLLQIGNSTLRSATATTTTTSPTTLVSLTGSGFRVAEFFISGASTGSKYSVATVSMVHDVSSADYSVYGTVNLPASSTTGSLSVTYAGGIANLVVTPSSNDATTWIVQYRTM